MMIFAKDKYKLALMLELFELLAFSFKSQSEFQQQE
jgi:hypothetical protein